MEIIMIGMSICTEMSLKEKEELEPKAIKRWEDLKKSGCYEKIKHKEIMILITGFGEMQNWSMRYVSGIFINTKDTALNIVTKHPFVHDQMNKITERKFKANVRKCSIDILDELNKIVFSEA